MDMDITQVSFYIFFPFFFVLFGIITSVRLFLQNSCETKYGS